MDRDTTNSTSLEVGGNAFLVRIQYRQNASWQGTVQWLEGKKTRTFRSLLELVMLINEAFKESGKAEEDIILNTWTNREDVS